MAKLKVVFGVNDEQGTPVEVDKRYIESLSSLSQSTSDPSTINYGTLENSGSLNIRDINGKFKELIDNGTINTDSTPVTIFVNDNQVQKHISTDNNYNKNTKEFSLSLSNKLKDLDVLKYKGFPYPDHAESLYNILYDVMNTFNGGTLSTTDFDLMLTSPVVWQNDLYQMTVKEYLQAISVEYPVIEYGSTYRTVIDNICDIAQLNMYADDDDNIKFVSLRPLIQTAQKVIKIPRNKMYSDIEETGIPKNKYTGVDIKETQVNDEIDINTNIYTYTTSVQPYLDGINIGSEPTSGNMGPYFSSVDRIARVETYYCEGSFSFPKKTNSNLSSIIKVNIEMESDSDNLTQHTEQRTRYYSTDTHQFYSGTGLVKSNIYTSAIKETEAFDLETLSNIETSSEESTTTSPSISITIAGETASASLDDKTVFNITEDETNVYCSYKVLCGILKLSFVDTSILVYSNNTTNGRVEDIFCEKYLANKVKITLYGDQRNITFTEISASSNDIENTKNKISLNSSDLLQTGTTFNGTKISSIIKENVLTDYKDGVPDATVTVCCGDLYYEDGSLAKNWKQGGILQVGDIVSLVGDSEDRKWVITGRPFNYDGSPEIPLSLMRVKYNLPDAGLYSDSNYTQLVASWNEIIENGWLSISVSNNEATLNSTSSTNSNIQGYLILPANVDFNGITYPLTTLSSNLFVNNDSLIGIVTTGNISAIGSGVFYNCSGLQRCNLYDSLSNIPISCFWGCSNLTNIKLPASLTEIQGSAFRESGLTRIDIPENVSSIANYAFSYCNNLNEIHFNAINMQDMPSGSYWTFLQSGSSSTGIDLFIGNKVTKIPNYLFYQSNISSINFEQDSSCSTIGDLAFYYCDSLTSIEIPASVTSIGNGAFENCIGLVSIIVDSENPVYDSRNNCNAIIETNSNKLIQGCNNTVIPNTITSIGDGAFATYSGATVINLPDGLISIGVVAFSNCTGLTSIYIPSSVETISAPSYSQSPFAGCSSSLVIYCGATEKPSGWDTYWNCYSGTNQLTVKWGYTREQYEQEIYQNT